MKKFVLITLCLFVVAINVAQKNNLNDKKLKKDKFKWQLINSVLPIGLIILFGLAHYYDRKKKFTK